MKKRLCVILSVSLLCFLFFGCGEKATENPAWLYVDKNNLSHSLNRFECTVQDGIITETEYVFRHPHNINAAAGMAATWKLGDEAPVYTDVAQMEGNNTNYEVHHLPVCLGFLESLPETPPEDCRISIWMPEEEELQELLTENNYLIGRVGEGVVRTPEAGELPPYSWQINKEQYRDYPVLFGVLLVEDNSGEVVSLILLEGTLAL